MSGAAGPRVWIARADGWVGGRWLRAGERVRLTPGQAAYEPVDPEPAPDLAPEPEPAPKRPARRRARP